MTSRGWHVAIVGAGVTGLSAAVALEETDPSLSVSLLESSSRVGGKVQTERVGRLLFEAGPDALFLRDPGTFGRLEQLGLAQSLVGQDPTHRGTLVLARGRLYPLPDSMASGVPRDLRPLASTRLLSPWGKARALLEIAVPRATADGDESVDAFVRRRFGGEVAERIAAPLLGGIYTTDTRRLSLQATLPHLREAERRIGSLLRAAWSPARPERSDAAAPRFVALRGGLATLPSTLCSRLERTTIRTGVVVRAIERRSRRFRLGLADGDWLEADRVIVTAPAYAAAEMLEHLSPAAAAELQGIRYASVAVVALAFAPNAAAVLPAGSGFLVSPGERQPLAACSFSSRKWPHCAPDGELVVRCHVHAERQPELMAGDDREMVSAVRSGLRDVLGLTQEPLASRVYRWPRGVASYELHHLDRMARLARALAEVPGLRLAGAGYRGVGIPECLRQGAEAAAELLHSGPASAAQQFEPTPR
jgi:protoporphyrinogen/coproporphyrinogen III oxidase